MMHIWLLLHRLRAEGDHSRALQQELYDLFQEDVEVRVRQLTSVSVSTAVTDLEKAFYGTAYALDMVRFCRVSFYVFFVLERLLCHSSFTKVMFIGRGCLHQTRKMKGNSWASPRQV
jgi:hypothetical protein